MKIDWLERFYLALNAGGTADNDGYETWLFAPEYNEEVFRGFLVIHKQKLRNRLEGVFCNE